MKDFRALEVMAEKEIEAEYDEQIVYLIKSQLNMIEKARAILLREENIYTELSLMTRNQLIEKVREMNIREYTATQRR